MDYGVVLQTDPPAREVVRLMRVAEDRGFTYGWTFDSVVLWQEPFVIYSQILANTSRLVVGPMVTNPSRVPVRHAERHVRQPDGVRHRPW
jgi:alkanesulfonate monooxygenase SsuD/methylene tetrahydromethanopterin reductase-like flavin-dependent oxidoreductase (luciferase family)